MKEKIYEENLFGEDPSIPEWKKEWLEMPEFIQEDAQPIKQIIVSFLKKEDIEDFAKLVEQNITENTRSLWYPEVQKERPSNFLWVDEDNNK